MGMSSFRRSLKAETKKMGKGGKGFWRERWRLPHTSPTPFMVIEGSYVDPTPAAELIEIDPQTGRPKEVKNPYHKGKKHRRRLMKNGSEWFADEYCSAGHDPHSPQPCAGCYAMDRGDKSVTLGDVFAFGVVHLAVYHGHPVLDENRNILMRKDNQGHVVNFSECTQRTCNFCRTLANAPLVQDPDWPGWQPNHITTLFGQRRYLELGKGHLSNLLSWDNTVSSTCSICMSQLTTDGFKCPYCGLRCIDMASDPRPDEQIQEAVSQPYPCMRCNRPVLLTEEVSCEACEARGGQGTAFSLFNTVLHGLREGEGMKSQMVLRRFETLDSFERTMMNQQLSFGPTVAQILQGKTIRDVVTDLAKPYDFPEMMKPKDLKEQAKRLEVDLPASSGGGGNFQGGGGYQPAGTYGGQQQNHGQQSYQAYGGQQGNVGNQQGFQNNQQGFQGNTGQMSQQGFNGGQQMNNGQQSFNGQQGFQGGQQGFNGNQQSFNGNQQAFNNQGQGPAAFVPAQRPNFS